MKDNILIHIPHSSLDCPNIFYERILIDKKKINDENIFVSDYLIDKFVPFDCNNVIKFDFSRLFCDVERFKDDSLEPMSKFGMGVIYEKDHNGKKIIRLDDNYRDLVIGRYYDTYHKLLDDTVSDILRFNDKCYIIDLHSFSDSFVKCVLGLDNNPDICIGYDEEFCDLKLLDMTIFHFKDYGYSVNVNYPYSGSLVPNKYYYVKDFRVCSIMIEINKRIYLDDNLFMNDDKYIKLKNCMDEYYELLNNYII